MNLNSSFNTRSDPSREQGLVYYDTLGHVRNVSFAPLNGRKLFLNYAYLVSGEFLPDDGTIILTFTTHIVTLKGHRLSPLFDSLTLQSLQHVAAVDERYAATEEETASYVTHIAIEIL